MVLLGVTPGAAVASCGFVANDERVCRRLTEHGIEPVALQIGPGVGSDEDELRTPYAIRRGEALDEMRLRFADRCERSIHECVVVRGFAIGVGQSTIKFGVNFTFCS